MRVAPNGALVHREHMPKMTLLTMWRSATSIADKLNVDFGLINRSRDLRIKSAETTGTDSMKLLVGDVKDKVCSDIVTFIPAPGL